MTQKQISDSILKRYVELKASQRYKLDYDWVKNYFRRQCKPSEFNLISLAIDALVADKLIEINHDDDITSLMLTDAGFAHIYKVNVEKTVKKMGAEIMTLFKNQRSMPNHVLILTWLEQMLAHHFNPAELAMLPEAISRLVIMGYVQKEQKNNFCLILTQPGYESLQESPKLKKAS